MRYSTQKRVLSNISNHVVVILFYSHLGVLKMKCICIVHFCRKLRVFFIRNASVVCWIDDDNMRRHSLIYSITLSRFIVMTFEYAIIVWASLPIFLENSLKHLSELFIKLNLNSFNIITNVLKCLPVLISIHKTSGHVRIIGSKFVWQYYDCQHTVFNMTTLYVLPGWILSRVVIVHRVKVVF